MSRKSTFLIIILFFFLLGIHFPLFAIDSSASNPNTVSMPWETFKKLWQDAQDEKINRERNFAFGKIIYIGETLPFENKDFFLIQFKANFHIETFGKGKKLVPFLSQEIDFETIELDGKPITWTEKDGYLHVVLEDEGIKKLSTSFSIKVDKKSWPRNITLPLIPHALSEIIVRVPDKDIEADFAPGVGLSTINIENGSQIRGYIPSQPKVSISWSPKNSSLSTSGSRISSIINTYINLDENGAQGTSLINFNIIRGQTDLFSIAIPDDIEILDIQPVNTDNIISQWFNDKIDGQKVIKIISRYRQKNKFDLKIIFEKNRKETSAQIYSFQPPIFKTLMSSETKQYLGIGSNSQLEIIEKKVAKANPLDTQSINSDIQKLSNNNSVFYYEIKPQSKLDFKVKAHKELSLLQTRIEKIEATSVMNQNGSWISRLNYKIKNNQSQFLKLKIPLKSRIQSVYLKQKEISPAVNTKGEILIPLIKSTEEIFDIEIIYKTQSEPVKLWGQGDIKLPKSNISIAELAWNIYIPNNIQVTHQIGQYDLNPIEQDSSWWSKYLSQTTESIASSQTSIKSKFEKTNQNNFYSESENKLSYMNNQIPIIGKPYSIKRYLIDQTDNQGISLNFFYIHQSIRSILNYLIGIPLLGILFWFLALIMERDYLSIRLSYISRFIISFILFSPLLGGSIYFNLGLNKSLLIWTGISCALFFTWKYSLTQKRIDEQTQNRLRHIPKIVLYLSIVGFAMITFLGFFTLIAPISIFAIFCLIVLEKITIKKLKNEFVYNPDPKGSSFLSLLFLLCFNLIPSAHAVEPQEIPNINIEEVSDGNVFLNWNIVKNLLEKVEKKKLKQKNEIGIDYSFGSPEITGDINRIYAELQIKIPINLLRNHFIKIPLLPHNIPITDAKLNGKPLSLNREQDFTYLEIEKKSNELLNLELNLVLPIKDRGGIPEFLIESPLIKGAKVELAHSQEIESIYINDVNWQQIKGNILSASMGNKMKLNVELTLPESKREITKNQTDRIKKTYSETFTLASINDQSIKYFSLIRYLILNQDLNQFQFTLPVSVNVNDIKTKDLKDWNKVPLDNERIIYTINTMKSHDQSIDIYIYFEQDIDEEKNIIQMPNLNIRNIARNTGYLGIETFKKASISIHSIDKSKLIDISEIPHLIKQDASAPLIFGFRYIDPTYNIELDYTSHKNYPLQNGVIYKANFTQIISPQGRIIVQASLNIKNHEKQFLAISLPDNFEMLNAFLNNKSIKPSINEKAQILLPLKQSSEQKDTLEFTYEGEIHSLDKWFGSIRIPFPLINLPIQNIQNDIYIPDQYSSYITNNRFKKSTQLQSEILPMRIELPERATLSRTSQYYLKANQVTEFEFIYYKTFIEYIYIAFISLFLILLGYFTYPFFDMKLWKKFFLLLIYVFTINLLNQHLYFMIVILLSGLSIHFIKKWWKQRKYKEEDTMSFNF